MLEDKVDLLFRVYLTYGGLHYFFDVFVKLYTYGFFGILKEGCKFWYGLHHLMTFIQFKQMWMLDHYPWFTMFPLAYHCFLVVFPRWKINNYIYGLAIVCYLLIPLYYKSMRNNKVFACMLMTFPLLLIPILNMATMDCNAQWDVNKMKEDFEKRAAAS